MWILGVPLTVVKSTQQQACKCFLGDAPCALFTCMTVHLQPECGIACLRTGVCIALNPLLYTKTCRGSADVSQISLRYFSDQLPQTNNDRGHSGL